MTRIALIIDQFRLCGRDYGGELLVQHRDALSFIDECERSGLIILGMDFYKEVQGDIFPLLSSADYSDVVGSPEPVRESVDAVRQLLKEGLPDDASWVSFVVKEAEPET